MIFYYKNELTGEYSERSAPIIDDNLKMIFEDEYNAVREKEKRMYENM